MAKTIIYLEDVIEALMECGDWYSDDDEARRGVSQCIGVIHDLPSAQPGRKIGEWIKVDPHIVVCPFCKHASSPKNFCADCGADLRSGNNE